MTKGKVYYISQELAEQNRKYKINISLYLGGLRVYLQFSYSLHFVFEVSSTVETAEKKRCIHISSVAQYICIAIHINIFLKVDIHMQVIAWEC